MKIKELKAYQAVRFAGNQETYFHPSVRGMQDLTMEKLDWGILVTTGKDQAVITFNNVAYAKPELAITPTQTKTEAKPATKPESKKVS